MGTGYIFLDKYNKIYEEFLYNASDSLYEMVKERINIKIKKQTEVNKLFETDNMAEFYLDSQIEDAIDDDYDEDPYLIF